MILAANQRVRCTLETCPKPADTSVPIPEVVPGVLGLPRLVCAGCGSDVQLITEEGAPDA